MRLFAGIIIVLIPIAAYILMLYRGWNENPISDDPDQYTRAVTQRITPFLRPLYTKPKLFRRRRHPTPAAPNQEKAVNQGSAVTATPAPAEDHT